MANDDPRGQLSCLIETHRRIAIRMKDIKDRSGDPTDLRVEWDHCISQEIETRTQLLNWAPIGFTHTDKAIAYLLAISQLAQLDDDEQTLSFILATAAQSDKVFRKMRED